VGLRGEAMALEVRTVVVISRKLEFVECDTSKLRRDLDRLRLLLEQDRLANVEHWRVASPCSPPEPSPSAGGGGLQHVEAAAESAIEIAESAGQCAWPSPAEVSREEEVCGGPAWQTASRTCRVRTATPRSASPSSGAFDALSDEEVDEMDEDEELDEVTYSNCDASGHGCDVQVRTGYVQRGTKPSDTAVAASVRGTASKELDEVTYSNCDASGHGCDVQVRTGYVQRGTKPSAAAVAASERGTASKELDDATYSNCDCMASEERDEVTYSNCDVGAHCCDVQVCTGFVQQEMTSSATAEAAIERDPASEEHDVVTYSKCDVGAHCCDVQVCTGYVQHALTPSATAEAAIERDPASNDIHVVTYSNRDLGAYCCDVQDCTDNVQPRMESLQKAALDAQSAVLSGSVHTCADDVERLMHSLVAWRCALDEGADAVPPRTHAAMLLECHRCEATFFQYVGTPVLEFSASLLDD